MRVGEVTLEEAFRQARLHRSDGHLVVAARVYRDFLDADPEQSDPLCEIGIVGYMRDKPQEARAWFNQAWRINAENPIVLSNFAKAYRKLGRTGDTVAVGERAVAVDPDNAAPINVGNACLNRGELETADRMYGQATECDPRNNAELETADYGKARP